MLPARAAQDYIHRVVHREPQHQHSSDRRCVVSVKDQGSFAQEAIAENYRRYLQPYLFDPWAQRLVDSVALERGQVVLDVAAGTGAVTHAAASIVGKTGRVIASDISRPMLASLSEAESLSADPHRAPIETLECSATEIALPDDSVDVVFCHQGFPFMPDRVAVAREMLRVLRPGGTVAVGVWALGEPLYPFDRYAEFVRLRLPESGFARAMATGSLSMTSADVVAALKGGGFIDIAAAPDHLTVQWPTAAEEARGIAGTPFSAEIGQMNAEAQAAFFVDLAAWLADEYGEPLPYRSVSILGRGAAPPVKF